MPSVKNTPARSSANSPWPSPYPHGVVGVTPSPARSTPRRFFKRPFPPPSPAKHIKASLAKRFGHAKPPAEGPIPEDDTPEPEQSLDKNFGYNKNFGAKFELGKEIGRGHFGHTCHAVGKKGELKDLPVAVKIISKTKVVFSFLCCFLFEKALNLSIMLHCFYAYCLCKSIKVAVTYNNRLSFACIFMQRRS